MNEKETGSRQPKWHVLLELLQARPGQEACEPVLEQLISYVEAQLRGDDYQARFPGVARHLDGCLECAQAYALLYETVAAEARGQLPEPSYTPPPDLTFLAPPGRLDLPAALRQALVITEARLTFQFNAVLRALLTPPAQAALNRSRPNGRYDELILQLTGDQGGETEVPLTLAVYADRDRSDLCLVEVTVEPPEKGWPELGGLPVKLVAENETYEAVTDDWGTAAFPDVPVTALESLRLEVDLVV